MKERIIFDNTNVNEDDYKNEFLAWCNLNNYDPEEKDLDEFIQDELDIWLEDEHVNLNEPCGDILVIADLGFWDGRRNGYKILKTRKVNGIFDVLGRDYSYFKFYCDRYNVKAELHHHDGTHYITFYEVREGKNIQPLLNRIYEGEEVTNKEIGRYCKSLRPKIAKIYGW